MTAKPATRLVDPGAQLERTSLAWSRTAFAIGACGALLVRQGMVDDVTVLAVLGVGTLAVAGVVWLLASVRYSRRRTTQSRYLLVGHRYTVYAVTLLVALVSLGACAAAFFVL